MSSTTSPTIETTFDTGPDVRVEPCRRRIRAFLNGVAVFDTTKALYVFERGHLPVYYIPLEDVRADLLRATDHRTHCPRKGDARYWSITVGGQTSENAYWNYPEPIDSCPDISGYVACYWHRVDSWFEEDDEVFVHARDPYKRVDIMRSSRHVVVSIDGTVVADTHRPVLLFETGLPTRYYIPKLDVRLDLLRASTKATACPYKGKAGYFSVALGDRVVDDVCWVYVHPIPEAAKIENHIAFFDERVDVAVDGVPQERPHTRWS